ncbi:MAG: hypothetical protein IID46_16605 [Planctomycetes bacterium]|nr:hypothetical protein [Planctomycetota bacterium]
MKKVQRKNRIWQCPQCRKQFKIPVDTKTPKLCPTCAAFEEFVEETIEENKPSATPSRWRFFQRKKKQQAPATVSEPTPDELQETQRSTTSDPKCLNCGGPLISIPMLKRHTVIRWCREFIHCCIAAVAFLILPPFGVIVGIVYLLLMMYFEKKRQKKPFWECQQCGRKILTP